MFRQNALVPQNLSREQEEKDQVLLKLYFDKLPDTKKKNKEFKGYIYALNDFFCINNVHIYN